MNKIFFSFFYFFSPKRQIIKIKLNICLLFDKNRKFKFLFMEIPKKTTWRNTVTYFFRWTSCFRIAWIVGLFLCVQLLHAQNSEIKISGSVLDASGEPVTGANVSVVGSSKGTMTDYKGNLLPPMGLARTGV